MRASTRRQGPSGNGAGGTGGVTSSYGYDANGNLTSATGTIQNLGNTTTTSAAAAVSFSRSLTYLSFNLPAQINQTQAGSSYQYNYTYGPDHERVKLITARPDDTITTTYIHPDNTGGLRYERDVKASGTTEHRYYVNSPAGLLGVQVVSTASGGSSQMRYYHRDHQGSITAITNEAGSKIESLAYEAFGERRNANGDMEDKTSPIIGISTDRGYTGHEHLDELNLIHMNGRIYDPVIGRFMTPDPHIQSPDNLQSYNRYTYVLNNPLMYTDPSGYFSLGDIVRVAVTITVAVYVPQLIGQAFTSAATAGFISGTGGLSTALVTLGGEAAALTGLGSALAGAAGGFAAGLVASGGNLNAAAQGAFSGGVFGAIGGAAANGGWDMTQKVVAHAIGGCLTASAGGGNCAQGAISAAVGKTSTGLFTESGS